MFALLLVPILVCGITVISGHPRLRLNISKYQGWLIYLQAAKYGSITLILIFLTFEFVVPYSIAGINSLLSLNIPEFNLLRYVSQVILNRFVPQENYGYQNEVYARLFALSAIAIILTWVGIFARGLMWRGRTWGYVAQVYYENSQIDYLLYSIGMDFQESTDSPIEERRLAFITLDTRKFYIGVPVILSPPDEKSIASEEVAIFPVYSGYRDEKDLRMHIKNSYEYLLAENINEIDEADLIAIAKRNIVTVSGFTMGTHHEVDDNMSQST